METIWQTGIALILWFQGWGDWLKLPMQLFSFLGSEYFFLVTLPLIYWCINASLGLQIGIIVLISTGINDILKLAFHGPRPYWFSSQVKAFAAESSFGVPSGHSQVAVSLWGLLAAQLKRPWVWGVAVLIILMIGLSRIYLGVHFPHDVLLGWALGALILWAFLSWMDGVVIWVGKKSLGQQVGLAFVVSVLMLVAGALVLGTLRDWSLPAAWLANTQRIGAGFIPAPVTLDSTITPAGVLFGMLAGFAWMNSRGGFCSDGSLWQRLLRLILGSIGILVLYLGLKVVFPEGDAFFSYLLRYVRYSLIGAWITAGAPWVFVRFHLAQKTSTL